MSPIVTADTAAQDFDLNIETIELAGIAEQINLTDDGCGSTCPDACTSAAA